MHGDIVSSGIEQEKDSSLILITVAVLFTHLSLFILSAYLPHPQPIPPPVKHLIVKTINLAERRPPPEPARTLIAEADPVQQVAPEPIPEPVSKPAPEPKPAPSPVKKEVKKEPKPKEKAKPTPPKSKPKPPPKPKAKDKPTPKKPEKKAAPEKKKPVEKKPVEKKPTKTTPKKESKPKPKAEPDKPTLDPEVEAQRVKQTEAAQAKRRELLANAQKSIAQIEQTRDKLSATSAKSMLTAALPGRIDALQVETFLGSDEGKLSSQEISYYDELAGRLKLLLRLPEYGEVKIKLTLERSGRFVKVSVVNAQSVNNRKYVEKTLPTLTYPGFGSNFDDAAQYTFVIALSNE